MENGSHKHLDSIRVEILLHPDRDPQVVRQNYVVDLEGPPILGRDEWVIACHTPGPREFLWDPDGVTLHHHAVTKWESPGLIPALLRLYDPLGHEMFGYQLRQESMSVRRVLEHLKDLVWFNACLGEFLYCHPWVIPKEWNETERELLFPATVFENKNRRGEFFIATLRKVETGWMQGGLSFTGDWPDHAGIPILPKK